MNKLNKVELMKYMWFHYNKFADLFANLSGSTFYQDYSGVVAENNPKQIIDAEIEADGRTSDGKVLFFEKLSEWKRYSNLNKELSSDIVAIVCSIVDTPISTINTTLILHCTIPSKLVERYILRNSSRSAVCAEQLSKYSSFARASLFEDMVLERFMIKSGFVLDIFKTNGSWETTFNHMLFLTLRASDKKARGNMAHIFQNTRRGFNIYNLTTIEEIEAFIFGCAGLLNTGDEDNEYLQVRREIFARMHKEYNFQILGSDAWGGVDMRKMFLNLAQLSAIIHKKINFISHLSIESDLDNIYQILWCEATDYWRKHIDFTSVELSRKRAVDVNKAKIDIFIINAIIPTIFAMHQHTGYIDEKVRNSMIELLLKIKAEVNEVVNRWCYDKVKFKSAYESQAIIQLHKCYCAESNCFNCPLF